MRTIFLTSLLLLFSVARLAAQNENISEGEVFDGEPFMAVDPYNAGHIVVVWMGFDGLELIKIKERVSFDYGNTFSPIIEIPHNVTGYTSADPSMDFDSEGRLYLCLIDYNPLGTAGAVYVYRSDDGGLTWNAPTIAIDGDADGSETPVDRPWMVIDQSATANNGNIYITTKPAPWIPFPNRNYFVSSTDGGASFSDWRYIDSTGWSIGDFIQAPMATPAVAANGIFYCVYPSFEWTESLLPRFILASTENAGAGFNYQLVIDGNPNITDTLGKYAYLLKTDPNDPQHLAFIYFWAPDGDTDIYMVESDNGGAAWSAPKRVNDDATGNGVLQDLVWADYDEAGNLLVTWRDRRNAMDTGYITSFEIYAAVKWKDSVEFSNNFKISDAVAPFNDVLYNNGNDFMCSSLMQDTIYAVWGDTRDGTLDIWFAKINAYTGDATSIQQLSSEIRPQLIVYPDPADAFIQLNVQDAECIKIFASDGKMMMELNNAVDTSIDIHALPAGNYFISIKKDNNIYSETFTKK